jgi:hypothetical protein
MQKRLVSSIGAIQATLSRRLGDLVDEQSTDTSLSEEASADLDGEDLDEEDKQRAEAELSALTVTESDAALTCGTWGWFRESASNNRFVRNEVDGAIAGVHLEAVAFDGFTQFDPTLNNTKVVNNALTQGGTGADPAGDSVGVELLSADADPDYDPVMENSKVIRNRLSGFATDVEDDGSDTKQRANVVPP